MTGTSHCENQISTGISGQKKSEGMKGADILGLAAVSDAVAMSEIGAMPKEINATKTPKTPRNHSQATTINVPEEVENPFLRNPLNDPNHYYKAAYARLGSPISFSPTPLSDTADAGSPSAATGSSYRIPKRPRTSSRGPGSSSKRAGGGGSAATQKNGAPLPQAQSQPLPRAHQSSPPFDQSSPPPFGQSSSHFNQSHPPSGPLSSPFGGFDDNDAIASSMAGSRGSSMTGYSFSSAPSPIEPYVVGKYAGYSTDYKNPHHPSTIQAHQNIEGGLNTAMRTSNSQPQPAINVNLSLGSRTAEMEVADEAILVHGNALSNQALSRHAPRKRERKIQVDSDGVPKLIKPFDYADMLAGTKAKKRGLAAMAAELDDGPEPSVLAGAAGKKRSLSVMMEDDLEEEPESMVHRQIGERLEASRYSGATMPWGLHKTVTSVPDEEYTDAALMKRGLARNVSGRVQKRAYGANDPENIEIVNLKENKGWGWERIVKHLNDRRIKAGKQPSLSLTCIHSRYNRTAPLLYASQGIPFIPLSKRRKNGAPPLPDMVPFTNEEDLAVVSAVKQHEANKWSEVARMFTEKTGKATTADAMATRFAML